MGQVGYTPISTEFDRSSAREDGDDLTGPRLSKYQQVPFVFKNAGALTARLTGPLIRYIRIRSLRIYVNLYIDD